MKPQTAIILTLVFFGVIYFFMNYGQSERSVTILGGTQPTQ